MLVPAVVQRLEILRHPDRTSAEFRAKVKQQLRKWAREHGLNGPCNPTDIESMEIAIRCAEATGEKNRRLAEGKEK